MKEKTVGASEFKAHCLAMLDQVAERGTRLVITKRGKPVAAVSPIQKAIPSLRGAWRGKVEIKADLVKFQEVGDWENP